MIKNEKFQKFASIALIVMTIALIVVATLNFLTFNYYYIFAHIDESGIMLCILQWVKISALLIMPLAILIKVRSARNIGKYLYFPVALISLLLISKYLSVEKIAITDNEKIEFFINQIIPQGMIGVLFVAESLLIALLSITLLLKDGVAKSDIRSFRWLPLTLIAVIPLNFFDNIVRHFSSGVYEFFKFYNFTVWHVFAIAMLIALTMFTYMYLKDKDKDFRRKALCGIATVLMIQYSSKMSVLIGDGYNVYTTLISAIPLFICNIGMFIVTIGIYTQNKTLYAISFFVHAGGALTVFCYFGKDSMSNYGTIFNYSFLFFTVTHALLFVLCVMPSALGMYKFSLRKCAVPLVFFFSFILVASVTSAFITSIEFVAPGVSVPHDPIIPNFSFTQINPLPIATPPVWLYLGANMRIDILYNFLLYLVYVAIFFAFFGGTKLFVLLRTKYLHNSLAQKVETDDLSKVA